MYLKNAGGQGVGFGLVNASNGSALAGATVSVQRVRDGATSAGTGTVIDRGNGQYWYEMSALDTDAKNVSLLFTATGAVPTEKTFVTTTVYQIDTADQGIGFCLVNPSTGEAVIGATVTKRRVIDGGVQAAGTGVVSEAGLGQYWYAMSRTDTGGITVSLLFTASGAVPVEKTFVTSGVATLALGPDQETAEAMVSLWLATPALVGLVHGGIHKDRLVIPSARPYARIQVKQGPKPNGFSTGLRYLDYREATITVWGIGDVAVGSIVPTIIQTFDNKVLTFTNAAIGFVRCEPLGATVAQEKEVRSGQDYRAATCRWCVWTDRLIPSV